MNAAHERVCLLLLTVSAVAASACGDRRPAVRLAVEATMASTGLVDSLRTAYASSGKQRVELVTATTEQIAALVARDEIDVVLLGGAMPADGAFRRSVGRELILAEDALVFIGPGHMRLKNTAPVESVPLLDDLARSGHLFLKGKAGSVERDRFDRLYRQVGLREPDAFLETGLDGVELVKQAVARKGVALVRRSALVMATAEQVQAERLVLQGRPELALPIRALEVLPRSRAGEGAHVAAASRGSDLMAFLAGEIGRSVIERFGMERFGASIYSAVARRGP